LTPVLQYRQAIISDIPAMAGIRAAVWGTEEYWHDRISGYLAGTHHPQQALAPRIIYVASENDTITGFIAGHLTRRYNCTGELEWINIVPQHQKKGIAGSLIKLLASWFIHQNSFRVCVDVDPGNTIARNFYKQHGATDLNEHWLVWEDIRIVNQPE
jgi:GNAT superfamily N-acetyltransferase